MKANMKSLLLPIKLNITITISSTTLHLLLFLLLLPHPRQCFGFTSTSTSKLTTTPTSTSLNQFTSSQSTRTGLSLEQHEQKKVQPWPKFIIEDDDRKERLSFDEYDDSSSSSGWERRHQDVNVKNFISSVKHSRNVSLLLPSSASSVRMSVSLSLDAGDDDSQTQITKIKRQVNYNRSAGGHNHNHNHNLHRHAEDKLTKNSLIAGASGISGSVSANGSDAGAGVIRPQRAIGSDNSNNSAAATVAIMRAKAVLINPITTLNYQDTVSYVYSTDDIVGSDGDYAFADTDEKMCRQQSYLPQKLFNLHSCAFCYHYMRDDNDISLFGRPSRKWETRTALWRMETNGKEYQVAVLGEKKNRTMTAFAMVDNPAPELLATFGGDNERQKWVDCCQAAQRCCERIFVRASELVSRAKALTVAVAATTATGGSNGSRTTNNKNSSSTSAAHGSHAHAVAVTRDGKCVATWDGWQCWDSADPGTTAHALCPNYIYFVLREAPSCTVMAEKTCEPNGAWFAKGRGEWTNYASCASAVIEVQKRRTYVHVSAYLVSIVTIIPALIVFFAYKQLRVHRIILHQNFLFSMLINGLLVVAFKTIVILSELRGDSHENSISNQNGIACRMLLIATKYSRMTNYAWMFCESFYLHRLIAAAFAEQKSLLVFYFIGWVFPIIPTCLYGGFRMAWANEKCWVEPVESLEWILNVPSLLSLLINMLFLINIIRVLLTKLRGNNAHANEPGQYRKAVKATLILLPLFGLHFVVTIYRPSSASGTCEWTEIYYFVNDILDGLQGFLVALIFCYLNGEVILLFKRTYSRWKEQRCNSAGGGCLRQPSAGARLNQTRHSRGGSMLGRSIVSTQCYSSVPASPEIITRLALMTPTQTPGGPAATTANASTTSINGSQSQEKLDPNSNPTQKNNNLSNGGGSSKSLHLTVLKNSSSSPKSSSVNLLLAPSSTSANSNSNQLLNNTIVQIKNNDPNKPSCGWTEVRLNGEANAGTETIHCVELKPQIQKGVVKLGVVVGHGHGHHHQNQTPKVSCNGTSAVGEHQL